MFVSTELVTTEASLSYFREQDALPGEYARVLTAGELLYFRTCPRRYFANQGEPRGGPNRWQDLLTCLHLTPQQLDMQFAIRPATFQATVLTCPVCGSTTGAAICRKCQQRRRAKTEERPWSSRAEYCAKWLERAENRKQTVVKTEEHQAARLALDRLVTDPATAAFADASLRSVWLRGLWKDNDTGVSIPLQALVSYAPASDSKWGRALGMFRTTRDAGHGLWTRTAYYAGYHVRAALALDLWNHARDENRSDFYYVLSEAQPPYEPARRQLSPQFLALGRKGYQTLLAHYARCLKHGVWPGYDLDSEGAETWTPVDIEPWMEQSRVDANTPSPTDPEPPAQCPQEAA